MLQITDVLFKFGDAALFDRLNCTIHAGHRTGLVGRNGVGKSTLFKLIKRELEAEEGTIDYPVSWQVAALEQNITPSQRPALDFVIDGHRQIRQLQSQIAQAQRSDDSMRLAQLLSTYEDFDGYKVESQAAQVLHGLGFSKSDLQKQHAAFSGGWRIRLNLARTLLTPSDLMLLDEPTNHLDLEATVWLQNWLRKYQGTLICVSHDREFLDRSVTEILHLENLQATFYRGNYTAFERQRSEQLEHQSLIYERQERERERIQKFINRFKAKATKTKQTQSRIKMLERMQLSPPLRAQSSYNITINSPTRQDNPMVVLDDLVLGYDNTPILSRVTHRIYPGNRIGLLGVNGAGKSTLMKALSGELQPLSGSIRRGQHTTVGYFAQHQLELLDGNLSPLTQFLQQEQVTEQTARNFLGGWGFTGDDIFRPIKQFSGGEKARLVLALISRTKPAILLLDEPTNHLDIGMRDELTRALQAYDGALMIVAHDRHMLRNSVDEFWLLDAGTVSLYTGDLDDYEARVVQNTTPNKKSSSSIPSRKAQRQHRAQSRAKVRDQVLRQRKVEQLISQLHAELDELTNQLGDPSIYDELEAKEIQSLIKNHTQLKSRINGLETEWEELIEQLPDEQNEQQLPDA